MSLTGVAPIILVKDVQSSASYWIEKVGFEVTVYNARFAIASRDGIRIMLAQAPAGGTILPNWRVADKTCDAYFWVDDAESLYKELIERGAEIDFTLYKTPWNMLEFGIQDLDDHDICFGQILS